MGNVVSFNPSILNKIETLKTFIANYKNANNGKAPTKKEIIAKFKYSDKTYKQYMGYITQFNLISVDKEIGNSSSNSIQNRTVADVLSPKDIVDMDEVEISTSCEKRDMIENMKVAFKKLNKYEQYVVDHYILRNEPLGKIAKAMKTNNAKVQEIHASAINKMRKYVNS
jgi:DNA-directed RNA polymerase specialized sigma subunit